MSVYTAAQPQVGQQSQVQQPYGYSQMPLQSAPWSSPSGPQPVPFAGYPQSYAPQAPFVGQAFGPQAFSAQSFGLQSFGVERVLPQLVADLALRCATTAVAAVVERLRLDPQALATIQAYGQIPAHVHSDLLVECARRIAPVAHQAIAPVLQAQAAPFAQLPGQPYTSQPLWGIGQAAFSPMINTGL
jgi:hypothetical protein